MAAIFYISFWMVCIASVELCSNVEGSAENSKHNILLLPSGFGSHLTNYAIVGEELASRGHNVYFALSDKAQRQERYAKKSMHVVNFHTPEGEMLVTSSEFEQMLCEEIFSGKWSFSSQSTSFAFNVFDEECSHMLADKIFLETVRELDIDLVIVDTIPTNPCQTAVPYYLDLPYILMVPGMFYWHARIPALPSMMPVPLLDCTDDMTFLQRLTSFVFNLALHSGITYNHKLLKEHFPELSSWNDLIRKSEFFIVTTDYHLEWPVPSMPNTLLLPGITAAEAKPLPSDLQRNADDSTKGIVLFSFGSAGGFMPDALVKKLFEAFAGLDQTVFMRLESTPTEVPHNVHIMRWLPQNDLLAHPNTKVFITHCGSNSQYEALYHGVPMVGIPLFVEQPHNAFRASVRGYSLTLDLMTFTSGQLREAILEIVHNTTYKNNIQKGSAIIRDRPVLPKEEAAYWIEHIIKHGGQHLRAAAMDLSLFQFFGFDVLLTLVALLIILMWILLKVLIFMTRCICKSSRHVKEKTQ